ncbi:conjugal transfer protein TrbM (plasmid) [Advenella kashmirensis WT001]|uniref:Conjugal transfer protein TrbM n=2 Tax=Advenella TaxID=290425 RepID=I3UI05_ADVKW|nr:TrbM/KikA/MpfK family conjugal transfer protein [Advenella kashmirensis]AFK64643.1 conjugal transfer protein TrbM [Advenella kashmirensis WT001]
MMFLLKKTSKHKLPALMVTIAASLAAFSFPAHADQELSGDEKDSCGALLCLASGAGRGESECQGYLRRYFSIKFTRPDKTFEARRDFLSICPTDSNPEFTQYHKPALINAIARGAGNCDAKFLNSLNKAYYEKKIVDKGWSKWNNDDDTVRIERVEYVKNELPPYCKVYEENEYTQGVVPIYVGVEKEDGHYVDPPPQ